MDVDVSSPHVNTVKSAVVTTSDRKVVKLAIGAGVQGNVEGRCVDELEIMDREVGGLDHSQETGTRERSALVNLIPVALHGAGSGAGEELDVLAVLDGDHVAARGPGTVDGSIQLETNAGALVQGDPGRHSIVTCGDDNCIIVSIAQLAHGPWSRK